MFQTAVLASGSKGNCIVIRTETTKILLDAGLSWKKTSQLLDNLMLESQKISGLIISHEHSDHVNGAGVICRKLNIPLYISEQTYNACQQKLGKLPQGIEHFENGQSFRIGDININAFASSHDVIDGSNFIFQKDGDDIRKLSVATDLGFMSNLTMLRMKDSTTIVLESNHDIKMLMQGPYPWHLKQRVKSKEGHLSNEQAVGVITQVIHPGLKNLVLAHISEKNNDPELARKVMSDYLKSINFDLNLIVASQTEVTQLIDI